VLTGLTKGAATLRTLWTVRLLEVGGIVRPLLLLRVVVLLLCAMQCLPSRVRQRVCLPRQRD
jgi:hypothetical protein